MPFSSVIARLGGLLVSIWTAAFRLVGCMVRRSGGVDDLSSSAVLDSVFATASCRPRWLLLVFQSMRSSVHAFGTCGHSWCATRGGREHSWGQQHARSSIRVTSSSSWEQSMGWFSGTEASGPSIADLFARKMAHSDQESTKN